jgi:hypothetical protein
MTKQIPTYIYIPCSVTVSRVPISPVNDMVTNTRPISVRDISSCSGQSETNIVTKSSSRKSSGEQGPREMSDLPAQTEQQRWQTMGSTGSRPSLPRRQKSFDHNSTAAQVMQRRSPERSSLPANRLGVVRKTMVYLS